MRELDREGLECVAFGHVVFDAVLELYRCEVAASDSLEFVVSERR